MNNKTESTEDRVTNRSEVISYMYASDTVNIIKFRDSSSGITNQYHHYIQQNRDFLNAVKGIDHRNIQCSALTLTSKWALAKI